MIRLLFIVIAAASFVFLTVLLFPELVPWLSNRSAAVTLLIVASLLCAVFPLARLLALLESLLARKRLRQMSAVGEALPAKNPSKRPERLFIWQFFIWQLLLCVPLGIVLVYFPEIHAALGIKTDLNLLASFGLGLVVYLLFFLSITLLQHFTGSRDNARLLGCSVMRTIWPRQKRLKWVMLVAFCCLNPVTEEFIFRGVLVHLGAMVTDNLLLAVTAGLIFSILAHLYQGLAALPTQLLFHSIAIAIVFSPLGLIGCVGYHLAADIVPLLMFRRYWRRYAAAMYQLANPKVSSDFQRLVPRTDARPHKTSKVDNSRVEPKPATAGDDLWLSEM